MSPFGHTQVYKDEVLLGVLLNASTGCKSDQLCDYALELLGSPAPLFNHPQSEIKSLLSYNGLP